MGFVKCHEDFVWVHHENTDDAEAMCNQLANRCDGCDSNKKCVKDTPDGSFLVVHDASDLPNVSEDYARAFAACFQKMKDRNVKQVACIPKATHRVMAMFATNLGGIDMKIVKNRDQLKSYMRSLGIEAEPLC